MSTFFDDVAEQPRIVEGISKAYAGRLNDRLCRAVSAIRSRDITIMTGMASSLFASILPSAYLGGRGMKVFLEDASEFIHYRAGLIANSIAIVGVSQSGETIETREAVGSRPCGVPLVAVCNNERSSIASMADVVLPILAGPESGTSTKTYVGTLAVLLCLSRECTGDYGRSGDELASVVPQMEHAIDISRNEAKQVIDWMGGVQAIHHLMFIGRGFEQATVMQSALIANELARVPAQGITAGSFQHGPLELACKDFRAVLFAPHGRCQQLMVSLASRVADLGSRVWLITDAEGANLLETSSDCMWVTVLSSTHEEVFPLLSIIPVEFFAAELGCRRGLHLGEFRNINKVTTSE